jgi:hypothetical protein
VLYRSTVTFILLTSLRLDEMEDQQRSNLKFKLSISASKRAWPASLARPAWDHFGPVRGLLRPTLVPESSRSFPLLHVGPCRQFLSEFDEAPCLIRFDTFLARSSEFIIFSGLVPRLLGVMFASLHDLYRASRSCHKVLDELIPEVLLSLLKTCINTKLQN